MILNYFLFAILIWNIIVMIVYGIDKLRAKRGARRISEFSLLLCAFLLGGLGAIFGMILFNHKTSKMKFRILVPISNIVFFAVVFLVCKVWMDIII